MADSSKPEFSSRHGVDKPVSARGEGQVAPKPKPIARRRPLKKPAAAEPRLKGKPTTADRMREAIQTKRVQIAKENLERLLRGEGQPLEKLPPRPKNFRA